MESETITSAAFIAPLKLAQEDQWIENLNFEAFKKDVEALGRKLQEGQGEADMKHLEKIVFWNQVLAAVGFLTLGLTPNPFTVACVSLAIFSRWTMIGHHVCHGGYDKVDRTGYYNRYTFGLGSLFKRFSDWLDWMLPEAWNLEHNKLHHYSLNEEADPDLVESNLEMLRTLPFLPLAMKRAVTVVFMFTWKWFYYAPNTYGQLKLDHERRLKTPTSSYSRQVFTLLSGFSDWQSFVFVGEVLIKVMLPYFVVQFVLKPLPFLFLFLEDENHTCFKNAVTNLFLAELLTNFHSFVVIVTNHAGSDLYRFDTKCEPRSDQYYLRQIVGSADFSCGNDVVDFFHGFLNYQIEHHLYPNLTMLSYQKAQPLVKSLCAKHGVPYVQENVFIRLQKTIDIMVGASSMRRFPQK